MNIAPLLLLCMFNIRSKNKLLKSQIMLMIGRKIQTQINCSSKKACITATIKKIRQKEIRLLVLS